MDRQRSGMDARKFRIEHRLPRQARPRKILARENFRLSPDEGEALTSRNKDLSYQLIKTIKNIYMEFVNLKMEDYPSFLKLYNDSFPDNERRIYEDEEHLANFIKMKGGQIPRFRRQGRRPFPRVSFLLDFPRIYLRGAFRRAA